MLLRLHASFCQNSVVFNLMCKKQCQRATVILHKVKGYSSLTGCIIPFSFQTFFENSFESSAVLHKALICKAIHMADNQNTMYDADKTSNRFIQAFQASVTSSWFSSSCTRLAEDGGMCLADYSPLAEKLCSFSDITPIENCLYPEFPDVTETDQELYGGSNESLAEKFSALLTDNLEESDSSLEENDVVSVNSVVSNEAEAVSQINSPLKSVGIHLSNSIQCPSLNTEDSQVSCGGESLADEFSSISEEFGQVLVSFASSGSTPTNSVFSEIWSPDSLSHWSTNMEESVPSVAGSAKPPNVLVFTGEDHSRGSCPWFESIANNLETCLHRDCYTIYLLQEDQILKDPWFDSTELLVVSCDNINEEAAKAITNFFYNGGNVLNFCTNLSIPVDIEPQSSSTKVGVTPVSYKEFTNIPLHRGQCSFKYPSTCISLGTSSNEPVIMKSQIENKGIVVISEVHLEVDPVLLQPDESSFTTLCQSNAERLSILQDILTSEFGLKSMAPIDLQLTPCYLLTKNKATLDRILSVVSASKKDGKVRGKNLTLHFVNEPASRLSHKATPEMLPVIYGLSSHKKVPFDETKYYQHLKTHTYGHALFFGEVLTTTMDVIESFADNGTVAVAQRQISGRGRRGNKWLSPEGCAMFSLCICLSLRSNLGHRLSIMQHLASLAIVQGIRKIPGYQNLDLRLKWPNDIYFGQHVKIGGVRVDSSLMGNEVRVYIGCGINVSNSLPTLCINDIIQLHNSKTGGSLALLTMEEVIAHSLTELENLIDRFQLHGASAVIPMYYSYWVHKNQRVNLQSHDKEATIYGLDEYGFLMVETDDGEKITLQPDGNSFNMLKNLIVVKS